jgi:hypothetical protein
MGTRQVEKLVADPSVKRRKESPARFAGLVLDLDSHQYLAGFASLE